MLRDELFCSSDGRLFQRIIERGKKTREGGRFFNKRDRVRFFSIKRSHSDKYVLAALVSFVHCVSPLLCR